MLTAPPGSGKTTRLPPALLGSGLLGSGRCLIQEPRRIAARAAARRVAGEHGWAVGAEVGYEVRFDRRASAATRLVFVTDGILTALLQSDPALPGVSAVLLDEFHERSLQGDLVLAFLREVRETLRPDLLLVVLSATLDAEHVAAYLEAEIVRAPGRPHPVEISHLDRPPPGPLPAVVAAGVRRAWARRPGGQGDVLAFLPGAGDIRRTSEALEPWAADAGARVLPLHGDLPLDAQEAVLRRGARERGRVILATNVAETSVTVEGLTCVVDSGLAKQLRHDPSSGLDRLEVARISRASADQRAGRAGRLGPGWALRLWTRHDELSMPARTAPEVQRADLSGALLEILAWGQHPERFPWLEPPSPEAVAAALALLTRLGALDARGHLTPLGTSLRRLPLHPRLGALVTASAREGHLSEGAALAALLSERDVLLSGRAFGSGPEASAGPSDLLHRLDALREAEACRFDRDRLQALGIDAGAARAVARNRDQIARLARSAAGAFRPSGVPAPEGLLLRLVLAAYPDRVARRREPGSDRFLVVGGRGAVLARESVVRRGEFVVAARLEASRRADDLLRWASRIERECLGDAGALDRRTETWFDEERGRVCSSERVYYEDLCVEERAVAPESDAAAALLAERVGRDPEGLLRPGREAAALLSRCRFLAGSMPELALPAWGREDWAAVLPGLVLGCMSLEDVRRADLAGALRARLSWPQLQALEREAPERLDVPSGSRIAVQYPEEGLPFLAVKIQEVFGWREGPRVAGGRVPVVLHLLGPHGRPLQVTSDLESFWGRGYPEVRREMRGRYPRHYWPEDPWNAPPNRRTTARPPKAG